MPLFQSTYHSKIYRDFKTLEANAYRKIIHFYEEKEEEIKRLDLDEFFEMLISYVDALFEVGDYRKHLLMVDVVIELSIVHNIQFRRGEDIYQHMLFKKAASLFNTGGYEQADYILRELLRIDPYDQDACLFLKKCLRHSRPQLVQNTRAASMFLFLLTAFVICLEVLLVRPFYRLHIELVETSRMSIFFLGVVLLAGGDLLHRWLSEREVNRFVASVKRQKRFL